MRFPQIEKRREGYVPWQCVSDHGSHNDARAISIRCNACHDPDNCPQCLALNAQRDALFAPMSDKGNMDRAIDAAMASRSQTQE